MQIKILLLPTIYSVPGKASSDLHVLCNKYADAFCKGEMLILLSFHYLQSWPPQSTLRKTDSFSDWHLWGKGFGLSSFALPGSPGAEGARFPPEFDRQALPASTERPVVAPHV